MNEERARRLRLYRVIVTLVLSILIITSLWVLLATKAKSQDSSTLIIGLFFNSLFSGAITAAVFSTLSARETEQILDLSLDRVLRRVFVPLRNVIDEEAIENYIWSCHVSAAASTDPYPHLGIQLMRFSYTRRPLPASVSVVCIGSLDDDALAPYVNSEKYLLRWQIERGMDPEDREIFHSEPILVNGVSITPIRVISERNGVKNCEFRYSIPQYLRSSKVNISISVITRKDITDSHLQFKVVLFSHVSDALLSCVLDRSVGCKGLSVGTNLNALGPRGESWSGPTYAAPHSAVAAHVKSNYPIQKGSSVTFYADR